MDQGYLTESQLTVIKSLVGHRVRSIEECHWRSDGEALLDYITFNFDDRGPIVLRVGSTAENVELISPEELEAEVERRDRSMFVRSYAKNSPLWSRLLEKQIMGVDVKDEKGYAHSSVIFHTSNGPTEITTLADALDVVLP